MLKSSLLDRRLPLYIMRTKLYIACLIVGMSVFTYKSSDSQNGPGIGSYTSVPNSPTATVELKNKNLATYCITAGASIAHGWIDEVTVGDYGFASGSNGGFADLRNKEFDIECGAFNSFDIKSGQSNTNNKHNWRIWIDYNQDGSYSNDEQVFSNYSVHMKGLVYIPSMAKLTYRTSMRIAMNKDEIPNACGDFSFGEVEDYTVVMNVNNIPSPQEYATNSISKGISKHSVNVFPNPANLETPLYLTYHSKEVSDVKVTLFDIGGRLVDNLETKAQVGNNKTNIQGMIPENGVYIVKVLIGSRNFIKKITVID